MLLLSSLSRFQVPSVPPVLQARRVQLVLLDLPVPPGLLAWMGSWEVLVPQAL